MSLHILSSNIMWMDITMTQVLSEDGPILLSIRWLLWGKDRHPEIAHVPVSRNDILN